MGGVEPGCYLCDRGGVRGARGGSVGESVVPAEREEGGVLGGILFVWSEKEGGTGTYY